MCSSQTALTVYTSTNLNFQLHQSLELKLFDAQKVFYSALSTRKTRLLEFQNIAAFATAWSPHLICLNLQPYEYDCKWDVWPLRFRSNLSLKFIKQFLFLILNKGLKFKITLSYTDSKGDWYIPAWQSDTLISSIMSQEIMSGNAFRPKDFQQVTSTIV